MTGAHFKTLSGQLSEITKRDAVSGTNWCLGSKKFPHTAVATLFLALSVATFRLGLSAPEGQVLTRGHAPQWSADAEATLPSPPQLWFYAHKGRTEEQFERMNVGKLTEIRRKLRNIHKNTRYCPPDV